MTQKYVAHLIIVLLLVICTSGCAALPAIIQGVGLGAQYLSSLVDVAETGSDAYLARHPNEEREQLIDARIRQARLAVAALNAALTATNTADNQGVDAAKQDALGAYEALRELLDSMGVLGAVPPPGGAETTAPEPKAFQLPTADEVGLRL